MTARNERRTQRSIRRTALARLALLVLLVPLLFGLDFVARWRWQSICDVQAPGGSQIWWTETSSNPLANRLDVLIARHDLESGERTQRRLDSPNQKRIPRLVLSPDRAWLAVDASAAIGVYDAQTLSLQNSRDIWPDTKSAFVQPLAVSQNGRYLFVWGGDPPRWAILDARTLTTNQETLTPNIFLIHPAASWSHQIMAVSGPRAGRSWQLLGFEDGRAESLESGTWTNRFHISADRTFTCESVRNGLRVVDVRRKQARFVSSRPEPYEFAPSSPMLVAAGNSAEDKGVDLVDCRTGRTVRTLSTRGERVYAVQVSADQRYVIATTDASSIFVWDFNTGQLRFHRDYWKGFASAVGGVSILLATWCLACLRLAVRATSSRRTIACVAVVAALLLFAVFWRHINNHPGYPLCFSAVGSVAVLLGSSALLAIGMVFGRGRVLVRLSLALAAFALLWAWPVWVWHNRPWRSSEVPLGAAVVTMLVAGLCFVAYRRGWRIADRQSQDARTDIRFQFPLRDILLLTAAIGIVLLVSKQTSLGGNFEWWFLGFAALICLTQAVVALVALWTALSQRTLWQRLTLGLVGVAAVSALAPLAFYGAPLLPRWWYLVTQGCEAAFIFGLLMPFRLRGYRWVGSVLP